MKRHVKYLTTLVALLAMTVSTWATDRVTINVLPATQTTAPGTVEADIDGTTCTLTVTPSQGYMASLDNISVELVVSGDLAQTPRRSPDFINVTVTDLTPDADPSGETRYSFEFPDETYNAEVTVNFQTLIAIDPKVTLEGWTYGETANTPVVEGNLGNGAVTFTYATKGGTSFTSDVPTNAGNYTVKVSIAASGQYTAGEATADFTISKATITDVTLEESSLTYTGEEQTVTVASVKAGDLVLTADDYEVSGNTGTDKGTYTVTVTAKENSNFTGSKTATFTIGVKAVSVEMIADIAYQTYTGSAITPTLTVKDGETTLTLNTDYTVEYTNNVNAGTATATITGMGNYGGTASKTFTIGKATITDVTLEESSLTYTGEEQTVTVASVKAGDLVLTADDYEVSGNTGTDKGIYTVTVTAKENSNFTGSKTATFTIGVKAVSVEMIADIADQTYTGSAITPTLTVKDGETTLTLNTDYTVEYTNNVNAGTATATITGMGNYGGTASKTFTINPKALTAEMVTLSPERFEYNGETQKPEVTVADDDLMTANDYTIENNGGKDVGTYEVVVTGKNNYTGVVTKTFEITNRTLAVGAEGDVQFAAGQTWASFYTTTENLYLPDGLMAYIVTAVNTTSATLKAINYVPKNVPVLLENNSTMTTDNSSADGNLLLGTTTSAPVSGISGMVYALHDNKLMQVTTGDIPAGRAYLVVTSSEAPQLSMIIDGGGSTAIDSLEREAENDVDVWFTLDGRKLQLQPTKKGLYIKNGKKIVVNN